MYFGRLLKKSREEAGFTVEQAAKKIGVSVERIEAWEKDLLPTESELSYILCGYDSKNCFEIEDMYAAVSKNEYRLKDIPLEEIFTRDLLAFIEKMEKYNLSGGELNLLGLLDYYGEKLPYEYIKENGVFRVQKLQEELKHKVDPVFKVKVLDYMKNHAEDFFFDIKNMDCKDFFDMFSTFTVTERKSERTVLETYLKNAVTLTMFVKDVCNGLLMGTKTIDGYTSEVRWNILPEYKDLFTDIVNYFNEYVSLDFEECTDEDYKKLWKQFRDDLDYKAETGKFRDSIPVEPKTKGTVVARLTDKGEEFLKWYNLCILPKKN